MKTEKLKIIGETDNTYKVQSEVSGNTWEVYKCFVQED